MPRSSRSDKNSGAKGVAGPEFIPDVGLEPVQIMGLQTVTGKMQCDGSHHGTEPNHGRSAGTCKATRLPRITLKKATTANPDGPETVESFTLGSVRKMLMDLVIEDQDVGRRSFGTTSSQTVSAWTR